MRYVAFIVSIVVSVVLICTILIPVTDNADDYLTITDVIIVDGQSNAEDWRSFSNTINSEYSDRPVKSLYYYGSTDSVTHYNDDSSIQASYGLQPMYSDDRWVIGGYGPVLCNSYAEKNGHDVCYINIGYSGQPISTLTPSGSVGTWGFKVLKDAMNVIKNTYDSVNVVGWIWIQGEADKNTNVDDYIEDFDEIQNKMNSFGADECYIVHTRDYYGGNANTAQNEIVESDNNVMMTCLFTEDFTEANGELMSNDPIHYSQKGRNLIAEELADVIPKSTVNSPLYSIISIIPILMIAGLIIVTIGLFVYRRF